VGTVIELGVLVRFVRRPGSATLFTTRGEYSGAGSHPECFRFGVFEVDVRTGELRRTGGKPANSKSAFLSDE